uniref:IRF tryptophan pentad repeat domain-containing protein n=1 Tax=Macrostomum lignano TaxID=282301 RepID=A0A1I8JP28_9PLAT
MASESASTGTASPATAVLRSSRAISADSDSPRESLVGLNSSQTQLRYYMLERDMDAFNNSLVWRVSADARITAPLAEIAQPPDPAAPPPPPPPALPDDLLLSVIIRTEQVQWNSAGDPRPSARIRGGPTPRTARQQMVLTFRLWRESPDNVTRLARELHEAKLEGRGSWSGQQAAPLRFRMCGRLKWARAGFCFYLHLKSGAARFEFWCPGQRHWSGNPEYKQRLGRSQSIVAGIFVAVVAERSPALRCVPGSTLHLLSDGIGDFFRTGSGQPGEVHSTRQDLKCRVRLPREIRRSNQAQLVLPETGSGEAEPPFSGRHGGKLLAFHAGPAKQRPGAAASAARLQCHPHHPSPQPPPLLTTTQTTTTTIN